MIFEESEALPDRDIAEYVREVAAQLAVMSRDAGLAVTAAAFELACSSATEALQRNAEPDNAA